jgi:predicted acetyltransferase
MVDLVNASRSDTAELESLLDEYLRELSSYREIPVGATDAASYPYLDTYWSEKSRHAFLVKCGECVVGFALVRDPKSTDSGVYEFAEFYIKPEYRRHRAGRNAVLAIWQRFPGQWELQFHAKNLAAAQFWMLCAGETATEVPKVSKVQSPDGHRIQLNFNIESVA